jgi:hypothetical protein
LDNGTIDYSKIKTEEYYKSHKFHEENISDLIKLGKVAAHIFPLTQVVIDFYQNLDTKLYEITNSIADVLKSPKLFEALPEKAKLSFPKQKLDVQYKMLINAVNETVVNNLFLEKFTKTFTRLIHLPLDQQNDFGQTMRMIIMYIQPWNPSNSEKINKINELINELNKTSEINLKLTKNPLRKLFTTLYELPSHNEIVTACTNEMADISII